MVAFLKENGYPISIYMETVPKVEEVDGDEIRGYETSVIDEEGTLISIFFHTEFDGKKLWAKGFFDNFEYQNKLKEINEYPRCGNISSID